MALPDLRKMIDPQTRAGRVFAKLYGSLALVFMVLLCLLLVILFAFVANKSDRVKKERLAALRSERPAVNVIVQRLVPTPISDRLDLPAVVEPWRELQVNAEVAGKVVALKVREGSMVRRGEVIAVIDPRDYEYALKTARASYQLARQTLERVGGLYGKGIIPKSEYDTAVAQAERAEAAMQGAELALERTSIKAPIGGVVNRLDAKVGLLLAYNDPVAEVITLSPVKVSVGIPESDMRQTQGLKTFGVTVDALDGATFTGTRHYLSKKPGTQARLYKLELKVLNPSREILPGMFARVEVVKRRTPEAMVIPLYSVISEGDRRYVYVEEDGVARPRDVRTGILEGWRVEVTSGLHEGDRVIVVGHRGVGDGQAVSVISEVADPSELLR